VIRSRAVGQFSALGQEDRLEIFRLLVRAGPQGNCVEEIKRRLKIPGSTLSHHLDALARSGLLTARRSSRFIFYAVNWRETANLIRFLTEDCCADMHTKLLACALPGEDCETRSATRGAHEPPALARMSNSAGRKS
jgi:DNA-binding transcriptional ArsR family regulator